MQQIDVLITTKYENYTPFLYEVTMPAIRIGTFLYILDAQPNTLHLVGADRIRKSYVISSTEDMLSYLKKDILKHYPEEVREHIVFTEVDKGPFLG